MIISTNFGGMVVFNSIISKPIPVKSGKESKMEIPQIATKEMTVGNTFEVFVTAVVEYTMTLYLEQKW